MWFEELTGFPELPASAVRTRLRLEGTTLHSLANGKSYVCGELETPSLAQLRTRLRDLAPRPAQAATLREVIADVQHLHKDPANAGALFQAASQFNLLEMISPDVTPEAGVGIYAGDHTQGPACAVAAGAGTIYRNYFAPVGDQIGQSATRQIDCLADLGAALGNSGGRLWTMRNGYALPSAAGLEEIGQRLRAAGEAERDSLRGLLRIGLQWRTQVTLDGCRHLVSQAYCSALPVAYSRLPKPAWAEFASLVLEAAYEATLCAALLNAAADGGRRLFLTLLGGGAFGNASEWIIAALTRALDLHAGAGLEIAIVSYGRSHPDVARLVRQRS